MLIGSIGLWKTAELVIGGSFSEEFRFSCLRRLWGVSRPGVSLFSEPCGPVPSVSGTAGWAVPISWGLRSVCNRVDPFSNGTGLRLIRGRRTALPLREMDPTECDWEREEREGMMNGERTYLVVWKRLNPPCYVYRYSYHTCMYAQLCVKWALSPYWSTWKVFFWRFNCRLIVYIPLKEGVRDGKRKVGERERVPLLIADFRWATGHIHSRKIS